MRRVAVLALALVAFGCALAQRVRFDPPSAQLAGVTVTGLSLSGGSVELKLDVLNPNSYTLRSTRLQVAIDLENTPFGTAAVERPLELAPSAHTEVRVPLSFTWSGVGAGARAVLGKGTVGYGLTGRALVDTPLGERSVDLRTNGTVALVTAR